MRHIPLAIYAILVGFAPILGVAAVSFGADPVDPKAIEGVWVCKEAVNDGKKVPDEKAAQLRLTLKADRFTTQLGEQVLFDSTYTVDASKSPAEIEMIGTEGDLKGKPALGIIQLDGGVLSLCYVMPGGERPKGFESQAGSKATLTVWTRAKEK